MIMKGGPSTTARAGEEVLTVEVDIEFHCGEAGRTPIDPAAERRERQAVRAALAGIADVVIGAVLGLADPLAGRLGRRLVHGEHVPAGALAVEVAFLDHRSVRIPGAPPGEAGGVLPHRGHPVGVDQVEGERQVILSVTGRQVKPVVDGGLKLSMSSSSTASNPLRAHMEIRSISIGLSASSWRKSTQRSSG